MYVHINVMIDHMFSINALYPNKTNDASNSKILFQIMSGVGIEWTTISR